MEIIGHRGAMGLEPENTLRSIKRALEIGVDRIEFDVYVIHSGEVVLMHDDTVDRTTNGKGFVWKYNFDKLRQFDAGQGERIPTIEEALDLIDRQVSVNIELKGPNTARPIADVIDRYTDKHGWKKSDFVVSSFNHKELRKFHKLRPDIETAVLLNWVQWNRLLRQAFLAILLAKNIGAAGLNPGAGFITQKLVDKAHRAGLKVNVYTIAEDSEVKRMAELEVDGIFCNFPDRAKQVLKR